MIQVGYRGSYGTRHFLYTHRTLGSSVFAIVYVDISLDQKLNNCFSIPICIQYIYNALVRMIKNSRTYRSKALPMSLKGNKEKYIGWLFEKD